MTGATAPLLIVISGLAASGKTTVGRSIAQRLSMPLIDKDEILEALFDSLGCDDPDQRHRLSRASDEVLYRLAASTSAAVLVNWWDQETAPVRLRAITTSLIEVFCECPSEVAGARFAARERHPGHLDRLRTPEDHKQGIVRMRETFRGPLGLSEYLVTVNTGREVDVAALLRRVTSAIAEASWSDLSGSGEARR